MSATIETSLNNTIRIRINGVLQKKELDAVQAASTGVFESSESVKTLILLDHFEGWERGADWGDMSFAMSHGKKLRRMAIVGEPKWETEAMMFVGAGVRRADIRFFPTGLLAEAESWLDDT